MSSKFESWHRHTKQGDKMGLKEDAIDYAIKEHNNMVEREREKTLKLFWELLDYPLDEYEFQKIRYCSDERELLVVDDLVFLRDEDKLFLYLEATSALEYFYELKKDILVSIQPKSFRIQSMYDLGDILQSRKCRTHMGYIKNEGEARAKIIQDAKDREEKKRHTIKGKLKRFWKWLITKQ